jgi:periplasmic protein TonB
LKISIIFYLVGVRICIACMFCLCFDIAFCQTGKILNESYFVYDRNWKACKIDSAKYLISVQKLGDTIWQVNNYNFRGPLISIETYRDENASVPNGYFAYFNDKGKIDSAGHTVRGLKNGTWFYYGDSTAPQVIREYEMGRLISEEPVARSVRAVSSKPGDKEAEFDGGTKNWKKYIEKNLRIPDRVTNLQVNGTVMVSFVVNTSGKIEEAHIVRSVEYSADQEALRVIKSAPDWIPAEENGRKLRAYRLQPITFSVK